MGARFLGASSALLILAFALFAVIPLSSGQAATAQYYLINREDGTFAYTLNLVIPQPLVEYYQSLNHQSSSDADLPKFITPYAMKPIANALRQIYPNDEDFTNGVLTLVHQIPYEGTQAAFYSVETIVRNSGDCDLFSFIAASILTAAGFKAVLLHYPSEEHMNIGVHLASPPKDSHFDVCSVTSENVTYYIAECTSTDWKKGWQVGECPADLKNAKAKVITLEDSEQISPGQVSASFKKLAPTTISIEISPVFALQGSTVTLKGEINQQVSNQNITLYKSVNGSPWAILCSTTTVANGQFAYSWVSKDEGKVDVRASWSGNNEYAGATSQAQSAVVLPMYFVLLLGFTIVAIVLCVAIYAVAARRRRVRQQQIV